MPIEVSVPGSKSLTNRALLMAALAKGTSTLHNVLISEDTKVMMEALKNLGIEIKNEHAGETVSIRGTLEWKQPDETLYLGNAGTVVRFLTAILAHQPFTSTIDGNERMRKRPLDDLIDALRELGADIDCSSGCPPLTIHGHSLIQDHVSIRGETSSQYISALALLAPLLPNGLTVSIKGPLTSRPYLDLTFDLMNKFFIQKIEWKDRSTFHISHQNYQPTTLTIEPDASSATYFLGIAALTGKTITIKGLTLASLQPDLKILSALKKMGCMIQNLPTGLQATGPSPTTGLAPLNTYDANDFPDGAMTLAILAAFANGTTTLTGLHTLKHKESDRLTALAAELTKLGSKTSATSDSLTIHGNPNSLHPASIATYNDHRMAMAFGMAQSRIPGLTIENPQCVAKTYPNFWEDLKNL